MSKTIFTAAMTGAIHTPGMSPFLPFTPKQIIEDCVACHAAGAGVVHIHVRDPLTGFPTADQDVYREIATEVKKRCDIVMCFTTGGRLGEPTEKRVAVVNNLSPEMSSLNAGSLNFALFQTLQKFDSFKFDWEKPYLEATEDFIFPNTFKTMREYLHYIYENDTKPEFEIYDVGMINNLAFLLDRGIARRPVYLQFVMGILGGIPATPENLVFLVDTARKQIGDFQFSVCAAGKDQMRLCTTSLILGGNARVGLEDSLYLEKGTLAKSNAEQVEKIIRIGKELGAEPASPSEVREILGLKGIDQVNF
ncbi:MAG TPA: 3-keto-5-aminohexanoate cleavage protein [Desulfomonilaceae bacterium]|nr:3-keto-5-aminohexanoate cleavage protein [Desulfomonilaceae bacterium]